MTSKVSSGRFAGDADDRLRRQVEDGVAALHGPPDRLGVAQVALGQLDLPAQSEQIEAGAARPADVGDAWIGPVEHPHVVAPLQQRLRQVRGNEAVRARDQGARQSASVLSAAQVVQGGVPLSQRSFSSTASL